MRGCDVGMAKTMMRDEERGEFMPRTSETEAGGSNAEDEKRGVPTSGIREGATRAFM